MYNLNSLIELVDSLKLPQLVLPYKNGILSNQAYG
jgi:hypothetical protein